MKNLKILIMLPLLLFSLSSLSQAGPQATDSVRSFSQSGMKAASSHARLIYETAAKHGAKAAIKKYGHLANGCSLEADMQIAINLLMNGQHYKDATKLAEFNAAESPGYANYNLLAKALYLSGDKKGAMEAYEVSVHKYNSPKNEAVKYLKQLRELNAIVGEFAPDGC